MVRCPIGKDVVIIGLQIWLPLNGNLNNHGLQNPTITNTGATISNNGKIGKCYAFDGSNDYMQIGYGQGLTCNNLTITMWIKPLAPLNDKIVFGVSNGNNQRLYIGIAANTYNIAFGSTSWGRTTNASVKQNTWQFLAVVINNNICSLYCDGIFVESLSVTNSFSLSSNFFVGGRNDGFCANTLINDVRIYNHAVSIKELKLIQQCLVLHYPMGSIDGKIAGRNLLTGTNRRESNPYIFTSASTDGCNSIISGTGIIPVEPDATYAIQCKTDGTWTGTHGGTSHIPADKDCSLWIYLRKKGTSASETSYDTPIFLGHNASYKYSSQGNTGLATWIWAAPSDAYTIRIRSNIYSNGTNEITVKMWDLKVEKSDSASPWTPAPEDVPLWYNNIIYDTSGYMNNGTATDAATPMWDSDSPRYSGSYSFDGKNIRYINTVSLNTTGFKDTWTISWWSKTSDMNDRMAWGLNTNNLNFYPVGGVFYLNTGDGASNPFQKDGVSVTYASYLGAWHHYIVTGDGTQNLLYIDGKSVGKAVAYRPIAGNTLRIGTWPYDTGHLWNGNISDFRIYATTLSSSDIEYLYKTSASVTKNGTLLLAGEVVE